MNTKITALLCWLLTAALFTCAQEKKAKPKDFKYGKISPAEFEIKANGVDSAASAVVLFDVGRATDEIYRLNIELPKNYQLDKAPKNEKVILPDESASFSFIFAAEGNKMMITSKITVKKPVYTNEEYTYLRELFKNIVRKQSEQIVLKKI